MVPSALPLPLLDNSRRMRLAQLAKTTQVVLAALLIAAYTWQYHLLQEFEQGRQVDQATAEFSDTLIRVGSGLQIGLIILAMVAVIRWQLRAYQNVHRLPGAAPRFSANMAGWGWFIPIAGFWVPFRVMADIGRYIGGFGSDAANVLRSPWDALLVVWWVLHLSEILMARILLWQTTDNSSLAGLQSATRLLLANQVLSLLADFALLGLLRLLAPAERTLLHTPVLPPPAPADALAAAGA